LSVSIFVTVFCTCLRQVIANTLKNFHKIAKSSTSNYASQSYSKPTVLVNFFETQCITLSIQTSLCSVWHCRHSPTARRCFDRYLLPVGPTAANPYQRSVAGKWDRQTDTVPLHIYLAPHTMQAVPKMSYSGKLTAAAAAAATTTTTTTELLSYYLTLREGKLQRWLLQCAAMSLPVQCTFCITIMSRFALDDVTANCAPRLRGKGRVLGIVHPSRTPVKLQPLV